MKRKPAPDVPSRSTRFDPDAGSVARIGISAGPARAAETLLGLVHNESRTGCAVILVGERKLDEGATCICQIGRLPFTKALVRWVKEIEPGVWKAGLEYQLET